MVEHGYAPREFADKRLRHHELTDIGIRHSLVLADIHARLLLLTRVGAVKLTQWVEGPSLWDSVIPGDGESPIPVRPDAYFVLTHLDRPEGKNKFHFFLEADRSTMAHTRMAAKIAAYLAYYEQGLYKRKYPGMPGFLATTVTETRSRAEELRKDLYPLIPHPAWRNAYLFIPFEDLTLSALLPRATAA